MKEGGGLTGFKNTFFLEGNEGQEGQEGIKIKKRPGLNGLPGLPVLPRSFFYTCWSYPSHGL
ncbi:MAG TPA: hypothetical protein DDW50_17895 [Firmicutes bacterium]|nr:hypothetical protein [Bacillota bacterium]